MRFGEPHDFSFESTALTPEAVDYVIDGALRLIAERRREQKDLPRRLEEDIRSEQRKLDNFLALIAEGNPPQAVIEQIRALEKRIQTLEFERQSYLAEVPEEAGR